MKTDEEESEFYIKKMHATTIFANNCTYYKIQLAKIYDDAFQKQK